MSRFDPVRAAGLAVMIVACAACGARVPVATAGIPGNLTGIPRSGLEVVGAMRFAHPSRALRSLAFSVRVTEYGSDTVTRRERAHALLPGRLRVAELPESRRSGAVRNRQRLAVFERGRRVATANRVDLATLLAYDLFAQSIDTTIMWLDSAEVRFGLLRLDEWDGRKAWVVGAEAGDSTSAQFWVDAERWHVLRVIQRDPRRSGTLTDVRFVRYRMIEKIPVPAGVLVYRDGRLAVRREMDDFVANDELPARVFDLRRWRLPDD